MSFININRRKYCFQSRFVRIFFGVFGASLALMSCGSSSSPGGGGGGNGPGGPGPDTSKQGTWKEITTLSAPLLNGVSFTISSESKKIIVGVRDDQFYISSDLGNTWNTRSPPSGVAVSGLSHTNTIASSADGGNLAVAFSPGHIYTSVNSGVSWNDSSPASGNAAGNLYWGGVTSSADGSKLVAFVNDGSRGGHIYTLSDSGNNNWHDTTPATGDGSGNLAWLQVACSSNCATIAAVTQALTSQGDLNESKVLISSDFGVHWHNLPPEQIVKDATNYSWQSIASSADGSKLVVTGLKGTNNATQIEYQFKVFTSNNSGNTWTERQIQLNVPGSIHVGALAVLSSDGSKIVVLSLLNTSNGYESHVFTSPDFGNSWTEQKSPAPSVGSSSAFYALASSGDGSLITFLRFEYPIGSSSGSKATKASLFTLTFP